MVIRNYCIGPTKYSSLLVQRQCFEKSKNIVFFFFLDIVLLFVTVAVYAILTL